MKHTMILASVCTATCFLFGAPVFADDEEELSFEEAFIFFELNNTDGDLGLHAKIDGDAWKRLKIKCEFDDGDDKTLLKIRAKSGLRKQGLTEIFFESAEPTFDELTPEEFFERFPEGECDIRGLTLDGEEMESETEITHLMPAPAVPTINFMTAADGCDGDLPTVSEPVTIRWDEVTVSHPVLGRTGEPIDVVNYEVVVEIDETLFFVSAILPPEARSFVVPSEIIALLGEEFGNEIKFEVLVRESSYNQTGVESCFEVD